MGCLPCEAEAARTGARILVNVSMTMIRSLPGFSSCFGSTIPASLSNDLSARDP